MSSQKEHPVYVKKQDRITNRKTQRKNKFTETIHKRVLRLAGVGGCPPPAASQSCHKTLPASWSAKKGRALPRPFRLFYLAGFLHSDRDAVFERLHNLFF